MSILVFWTWSLVRTVRLLKNDKICHKFMKIFDQNLMKFLTFLILVKISVHLFLNLLIVIWQFFKYFKNHAQAVNSEKWPKCLKPLPGQVHDGLKKWSKNGHFWWFFWWFFRLALLHVTFWSALYKFWVQN